MKDLQLKLLMRYNGVYLATKEWDDELDMIKLRMVNETFKAIYAEQGI